MYFLLQYTNYTVNASFEKIKSHGLNSLQQLSCISIDSIEMCSQRKSPVCNHVEMPLNSLSPFVEFPTNLLEMTAVANIFDLNSDGFIDYYEFVSALHPSRDPYRKTLDADQINEEVRLDSMCWLLLIFIPSLTRMTFIAHCFTLF